MALALAIGANAGQTCDIRTIAQKLSEAPVISNLSGLETHKIVITGTNKESIVLLLEVEGKKVKFIAYRRFGKAPIKVFGVETPPSDDVDRLRSYAERTFVGYEYSGLLERDRVEPAVPIVDDRTLKGYIKEGCNFLTGENDRN